MKHLTETYTWEQIVRDAVEHRAQIEMQKIYYDAGYRAGVRDAGRDGFDSELSPGGVPHDSPRS
jgi:hypothetical protein